MQTLTLDNNLEQEFIRAAQRQGRTAEQVLHDLIREYLEDCEDARLAEAALRRIENGESSLVDWQDAKKLLHDVEH